MMSHHYLYVVHNVLPENINSHLVSNDIVCHCMLMLELDLYYYSTV